MPNPMKLLKAKPTSVAPVNGVANRWAVTLQILPQSHSDSSTRVPFYFDGQDIIAGDWFSNAIGGVVWKIISITSATPTQVVLVMEDVQSFNTLLDPTGNLDGGVPNNIDGFVFTVSSSGVPVLSPLVPNVLIPQWQTDVFGRFEHLKTGTPAVDLPDIVASSTNVTVVVGSTATLVTLSAVPQGATRTMSPQDLKFEWVDASTKQAIRLVAGMTTTGQYTVTITDTQSGKTPVSKSISVQVNSASLPAITADTTTPTVPLNSSASAVLSTLSAPPSGATRTISDNRFALSSDKTKILFGVGITNAGTYPVTVTDTASAGTTSVVINVTVSTASTALPAPTISPNSATITASTAPGTLVFTVSAITSGTTRSALSPNDGRFVWVAGSNQTQIAVGSTAITAGSVTVSFTDTNANTTPTSRTSAASVEITSSSVTPGTPQAQKTLVTETMEMGGNPAGFVTMFGHTFAQGDVTTADTVTIQDVASGDLQLTQFEPQTFYDDGSVRHALMAVENKAGSLGAKVSKRLVRNPSNPPTATAPTFGSSTFTAVVTITPVGGTAHTFDLMATLPSGRWRSGSLVQMQRSVYALPTGVLNSKGFTVIGDLAVLKDGSRYLDLSLRNTEFTKVGVNTVSYDLKVVLDGVTVMDTTRVNNHNKFMTFEREFYVKNGALDTTPRPILYPNNTYFARSGVGIYIDPMMPLGSSLRNDTLAGKSNNPNWDVPLTNRGIAEYMPNTGGRRDIGSIPGWDMVWLTSNERGLFDVAYGIAEGSGIIPWHVWDPNGTTGKTTGGGGSWMNAIESDVWFDGRDDRFAGPTDTDIRVDNTHQPAPNAIMYAVTGRRTLMDKLAAQACYMVSIQWGGIRGSGLGNYNTAEGLNIFRQAATRGSAWGLRDLLMGAFLVPKSQTPVNDFFRKTVDANINWVISRIPSWRSRNEYFGFMDDSVYGDGEAFAPWMNDYLASSFGRAHAGGIPNMDAIFEFTANWQLNRFLKSDDVFYPTDGVAYNILRRPPTVNGEVPANYTTWKQLRDRLVEANKTNGSLSTTTWKESQGNYPIIAMQAVWVAVTRKPSDVVARKALEWLLRAEPVFTGLSNVGNSGDGIWGGVSAPGYTRGDSPIVITPNQTFSRPNYAGTEFAVLSSGSYPTAWSIIGDAKGCSISNAGVVRFDSVSEGTFTLNLQATSKFGGGTATGSITVIVTAGSGEVIPDAPVITAGQATNVLETTTANTKVFTFAVTGGNPTSGTITLAGANSPLFEIRNGKELWTKVDLTGQATPAKNYTVTLTNAGGSSTEIVSINITTAASVASDNFYGNSTSTKFLGKWSIARPITQGYTGPAFIQRNQSGVERTVSFTNGEITESYLRDNFQQFGETYLVKWFDQTGNGNHWVQPNPDLQPRLTARSNPVNGKPGISFGYGRHMYIENFIINNGDFFAASQMWAEFFDNSPCRVVSFTQNGKDNDYDNVNSTYLGIKNGVEMARGQNGDYNVTHAGTVSTNKTFFGAMSFGASRPVFVQCDGTVVDGTFQTNEQFGVGKLRLGARNDAGDDWGFFDINELAVGTATTKADMASIYTNMRGFGTPTV